MESCQHAEGRIMANNSFGSIFVSGLLVTAFLLLLWGLAVMLVLRLATDFNG